METVLGSRSGTAYGDGWVRSTCTICMNRCGILAHVNDDSVVDKILGDPDNPHNGGRTCAKGDVGFEGIADPDRITTPLRRTNPEKGVGVDARGGRVPAAAGHPAGRHLPAGSHPVGPSPAVCGFTGRGLIAWP